MKEFGSYRRCGRTVALLLLPTILSLYGCNDKPSRDSRSTSAASAAASKSSGRTPVPRSTSARPTKHEKASPTDPLQKRAYAFALDGKVLYGGTTAGVVAWSLDDKGGKLTKRAGIVLAGSVQNLVVDRAGESLLVSTGPTGLARIDTSKVAQGRLEVKGQHPWSSEARGGCYAVWQAVVLDQGKEAALACGTGGVALARLDGERGPRVLHTQQVAGYVRDISLVPGQKGGSILAAAAGRGGVVLLRKEGNKLAVIGRIEVPGEARAVVATGNLLLVAAGSAGLQVVRMEKGRGKVVGAYEPSLSDYARGIALDTKFALQGQLGGQDPHDHRVVDRTVAYLCAGEAGILAVDFSDPEHPKKLGSYDPKRAVNRAVIRGDKLYAANDDGGVLVLDISEPQHLRRVGSP